MSLRTIIVDVLLVAGCAIEVLAVIGVLAMRNVYDRLHYVGLSGLGALLISVAILVQVSFSLLGDKALATGVLLLLLSPVVVHVTARSLRIREFGDWRGGDQSAGTREQ